MELIIECLGCLGLLLLLLPLRRLDVWLLCLVRLWLLLLMLLVVAFVVGHLRFPVLLRAAFERWDVPYTPAAGLGLMFGSNLTAQQLLLLAAGVLLSLRLLRLILRRGASGLSPSAGVLVSSSPVRSAGAARRSQLPQTGQSVGPDCRVPRAGPIRGPKVSLQDLMSQASQQ